MGLFAYSVSDSTGAGHEGTIEARSEPRAVQALAKRGFTVQWVRRLGVRQPMIRWGRPLDGGALRLFNEKLLAAVRSGRPLGPSLHVLAKDCAKRRVRRALTKVACELEAGLPLEQAVSGLAETFPPAYVGLVRAGARCSGGLAQALECVNTYSREQITHESDRFMATTLGLLVFFIAVGVVCVLLLFVVPVFAETFSEFGSPLPYPTRMCIALSDLLRSRWGLILLDSVVMALIALAVLLRTSWGKNARDWLLSWLPVVGPPYRAMGLARFSRFLAPLSAAKMPLSESLNLAAASADSGMLRRAVDRAALKMAEGYGLSDALETTGYFGSDYCWMLRAGETSGRLETALAAKAEAYEKDPRRVMAHIGIVALYCLLPLLVGWIIIALYLPIFTLGDAISGS